MTVVGAISSESVYTITALTTRSLVAEWGADERLEFYALFGACALAAQLFSLRGTVVELANYAAMSVLTADVLDVAERTLLGRAAAVQLLLLAVLLAAAPPLIALGPSVTRSLFFAVGVSWSRLAVAAAERLDVALLLGLGCAAWLWWGAALVRSPSPTAGLLSALLDRVALLTLARQLASWMLDHGPSGSDVGLLLWAASSVLAFCTPLPAGAQPLLDSVLSTMAIFIARGLLRPSAPLDEVALPAAAVWAIAAALRARVPPAGVRLLNVAIAVAAFVTIQSTVIGRAVASSRASVFTAYAMLVLYVSAFGLS